MKKKNTLTGKRKPMAVHSTYEVRWKNFKGFEDTDWIPIKPITVLIGANNSGKTSFISPLLLMSQTLSSRDAASPLIVKGPLYDGGNISELAHKYDLNNDMFFGFRYHTHERPKNLKAVGSYMPGAFEVIIGKSPIDNRIIVKSETVYDLYLQKYFSIYKDLTDKYRLRGLKLSTKERNLIGNGSPTNFLFTPVSILSKSPKKETTSRTKFSDDFELLLQVVSDNFSFSQSILMNLSYLGPLREAPHRYYQITNENYSTVGQKGENTPNLIKRHLNRRKKEINNWIQRFGFGQELALTKISEDLYSINFKEKGQRKKTNIANTGFGASQILPLIVQALISSAESLTIAEQPEIHLNPRLQGVLAELFCYMAKHDQRIIVETHSEHLLLRLRTLVAKKEIPVNDIAIYFVEKKQGTSKIRPIEMNENGVIKSDEWPTGFFADTLKESLALAAQQAKNRGN
jgi:predicted ATPase